MTVIGLRPATRADDDFCFGLHKAAMGEYVTRIWGWDDAVQHARHRRAFDPERWQIITIDTADAGVLVTEDRPAEIYLARIEIHPDHQGRGVGSVLLRRLVDRAHRSGRHVTLDVLTINQRAYALYRRHGFHELFRHGPGDLKIRMTCA